MKSRAIPLRLSESILELAAISSQEQRSDKATVLRQWLYRGAENYALHLVEEGRLSATRAAELLDLTLFDFYLRAEQQGHVVGATREQYEASLDAKVQTK